ncbi:hypothetical protein Bca4012_064291 [Brassica carinata]
MSENERGEDFVVGKSNLLTHYARNKFNTYSKATIVVEFQTHSMLIDDKNVKNSYLGDCRSRTLPRCHSRLLPWSRRSTRRL